MGIFYGSSSDDQAKHSLLDNGFNKLLNKEVTPPVPPTDFRHGFTDGNSPLLQGSGELTGNVTMKDGYLQSSNFEQGVSGWRLTPTGRFIGQDITLGNRWITISTSTDSLSLAEAIEELGSDGGTVFLSGGTYVITNTVTGGNGLNIYGDSSATTTINFSGTVANIQFAGSDVYDTGTITSVAFGVVVTGSATSWESNVTTSHQLFIGQRWYKISSVDSDTQITLSEGFAGLGAGDSFPGVSYRAAIPVQGIQIKNLTVTGSTSAGLDCDDVRNIILEDVNFTGNATGIDYDYVSEVAMTRTLVPANTGNGVELTSVGFARMEGLAVVGNGGSNVVMNDCRVVPFLTSSFSAGTVDGINLTNCEGILIEAELAGNGGQGAEAVSSNRNIIFQNCLVSGNVSDGIKLTATSDSVKITQSEITANGGWGINSAASTNNDLIVSGNVATGNTSGAINDQGIGSTFSGNTGILDKKTEQQTNGSGGQLTAGDVVVYGSGALSSGLEVKILVIAGGAAGGGATANAADKAGGGGGAGDYIYSATYAVTPQAYTVTVGTGGTGVSGASGNAGGTSVFNDQTATGGGPGGGNGFAGGNGGSEGGGAEKGNAAAGSQTGAGTGNNGAAGNEAAGDGGGGGGAGSAGSGRSGGSGTANSISGSSVTYSVGGGGGQAGSGLGSSTSTPGSGGAGRNRDGGAGAGGSGQNGRVIVRYVTADFGSCTGGTITTSGSDTIHTFTTSGTFTAVGPSDPNAGELTTTTTAGASNVFGVVQETIADGATGSIQTDGLFDGVKVNGTDAISIGDFIGSYTTAGVAQKVTTGETAFAIALEGYDQADSNGRILARIVHPRKL
jgi:hypothetical protein